MNKISSEKETKIVSLYRQGDLSISKIAKIVGVSHKTASKVLKKTNEYNEDRHRIPKDKRLKILELFEEKYSCRKISRELGINLNTVFNELRKNNKQIIPQKKYTYNENIFENIDSEEKAYWLGFLFADGHVRLNNLKKIYRLKVSLSKKDEFHLKKFATFVGNVKIHNHKYKNKDYVDLYVNNIKIVKDLIAIGCVPRKSLILEFPKITNHINHFIRGYFDGDGWASIEKNKKRLKIGFLGTLNMLSHIKNHIGNCLGVQLPSIFKRGNIHMFTFGSKLYNKKIYDYFYKDATIFLERKRQVYLDYFNLHSI